MPSRNAPGSSAGARSQRSAKSALCGFCVGPKALEVGRRQLQWRGDALREQGRPALAAGDLADGVGDVHRHAAVAELGAGRRCQRHGGELRCSLPQRQALVADRAVVADHAGRVREAHAQRDVRARA
jgi:hypothetical protein